MVKNKIVIIRNAKNYDFGGGERFPVFLGEVLKKNNLYPIIATRHPRLIDFADRLSIETVQGWWWSKQNWNGIRILLTPIYLIWQIMLFFWYLQLFIKINPKVIHIQSKDDFIAATLAGKILDKKVIWTDHADLKHIWKNINIWYKNPVGKLVHWSARFADKITVISNSELSSVQNNLKTEDIINSKLVTIYNGVVDVSQKYKLKPKNEFTYCIVSRLVTDKGIGEAILAFNKISYKYPNDQLLIIGDGPDSKKFESLAKNNPNIKLLGYKIDPLKYLAQSDIFIHPAYHEGFGISLVEASMLNKPIIATAIGGITEIIKDHQNGLLIKEKDVKSLQKAMELLRENKELRNKLANNARQQYLNKFQFDQIVKKEFIPLYEKE